MKNYKESVATKLLNPEAFVSVNKIIGHTISLHAAVVLGELIFKRNNFELNDDGAFFYTNDELAYDCMISIKQLAKAKKQLIDAGLIMAEVMGIPARTFYIINDGAINGLIEESNVPFKLEKKEKTAAQPNRFNSSAKTAQLDTPKGNNWTRQNGNTREEESINKKAKRKKPLTRMTSPEGSRSAQTDDVFLESLEKGDVLDISGDSVYKEEVFQSLPNRSKSGKVKLFSEDMDPIDFFSIHIRELMPKEERTYEYIEDAKAFISDLVYNVKEAKDNAAIALYDTLVIGLDRSTKWYATDKDYKLINDIEDYVLDSDDITEKIFNNIERIGRGELEFRFGKLFVGLKEMNNNLENIKAG